MASFIKNNPQHPNALFGHRDGREVPSREVIQKLGLSAVASAGVRNATLPPLQEALSSCKTRLRPLAIPAREAARLHLEVLAAVRWC